MAGVQDKVAIITGGARGIGRATCLLLAKKGATVAVTDIIDGEGQQVVDEIKADGGNARFWHLDVTSEQEIITVFADIQQTFGKITVLMNNAGIMGANKPTHEVTEEEWDKVISINVKGTFFCTKHAVPQMKEAGGGSIINVSSIYGMVSSNDMPPYHASKGAVRLMAKTDALMYAKDNIRVNSIHPGIIWTPLVKSIVNPQGGDDEEIRKRVGNMHPIGRIGEPEDIANGVLFLASDETSFVTGSELVIDGGYTAR